MANQLLTISKITQEALPILRNNLSFASAVNRKYSGEFAKTGAKIGNTVNVRKPVRYTVSTGPALQPQDTIETYVPVTLTNQDHVDVPFYTADLALSVDDYAERILQPAMAALANKIEWNGLQSLYKKVFNHVGTVGTPPAGVTPILAASQRLNEMAAPYDGMRAIVVNPASQSSLVGGLTTLFNPSQTISKQFSTGKMGDDVLGFNFGMSQNIPVHIYGTQVAATNITAAGAQAGGTGLTADASTSFALTVTGATVTGTITAGTVISCPTIFAVNPQNRSTTGAPMQFVVTADVAAAAGTINIFPIPVFSGPNQNVTSATGNIPNLAVFNVANPVASTQNAQNMAFHPDAFTLATADLELPASTEARRANYEGLSIRVLKTYVQGTDQEFMRIDCLYGWQAVYPELAVRLTA